MLKKFKRGIKKMEKEQIRQEKANKLISKEPILCVSGLVEECFLKGIFNEEDIENLYLDEKMALSYGYSKEEAEDGVMQEVLEWYLVNPWIYEKLKVRGEPVLTYADFNYFWGRTCSGQSVILDSVIQEIAEECVKW
jgi:hypothetical protein